MVSSQPKMENHSSSIWEAEPSLLYARRMEESYHFTDPLMVPVGKNHESGIRVLVSVRKIGSLREPSPVWTHDTMSMRSSATKISWTNRSPGILISMQTSCGTKNAIPSYKHEVSSVTTGSTEKKQNRLLQNQKTTQMDSLRHGSSSGSRGWSRSRISIQEKNSQKKLLLQDHPQILLKVKLL